MSAVGDAFFPSFLPITTTQCLDKYLSLVLDLDCIKFTISKGLGYGIVLGAVAVKLPQVFNIVSVKTVDGLAPSTYLFELISYTVYGVYCFRKNLPFSTFGENLFLALQNLVLLFCFLVFPIKAGGAAPYSGSQVNSMAVTGTVTYAAIVAGLYLSISTSSENLSSYELALGALPNFMILTARLPQIWSNFSSKNVGVLSMITQSLTTAGCLARVFTTVQEVDDFVILGTACLAFGLNLIVFIQLLMYPGATAPTQAKPAKANTKKGSKKD
eukprot:TRINITY_DN203_c0_g1_i6.p1 TRINITY_DN203_c0_g1~~TRINITY_DN203_c0_g1_i6.p1  ORF type:complete len:271 (-),score=74.91 TRINITY_DN203_c0_g1_i6:1244-2056(-)